ncbi:MAG: ATP-binding protein [Candidatus Magasanikbacteria bacterium]|nr:ATP-binding protein [Candidatus Magasanikbacteria bacterium]
MLFKRLIEDRIKAVLFKKRMVSILGSRQSGKTTLAKKLIQEYREDGAYYDCELAEIRKHFIVGRPDELLSLTKGREIVIFDEAQTIQDIGTILKVFHDTYPGVQIIATGSSSFDLANKINEPMTGRIFEFTLLPLSLVEISMSKHITADDLMQYMLYGTYPAIVAENSLDLKKTILKNIATQYLYKDVFTFEAIRNPRVFEDLVKLLALQIGSLVSLNELANQLGVSRSVIQRYVRLLEQAFIIRIVHSFSNNPRNEIKKGFKVFFFDTGVRNALVDIASPMKTRADRGAIFENYFVSERMKSGSLEIFPPEIMFWRSRAGAEIDVVEKSGTRISAFECKWKDIASVPAQFSKAYPSALFQSVNSENILEIIVK